MRLIDADALKEKFEPVEVHSNATIREIIDNAPTVDNVVSKDYHEILLDQERLEKNICRRTLSKVREQYCFNCFHRNDFHSKEDKTYCEKHHMSFSDYDRCDDWRSDHETSH